MKVEYQSDVHQQSDFRNVLKMLQRSRECFEVEYRGTYIRIYVDVTSLCPVYIFFDPNGKFTGFETPETY